MRRFTALLAILTVAAAGFVVAVAPAQIPHAEKHGKVDIPTEGVAVLLPMKGQDVEGTLLLVQHDGYVQITGKVTGLTPGDHGFHIHEFGDLRDREGKSAGDHFNPTGSHHGGPDSGEHHAGDLGNIKADESGVANVDTKAKDLELHFVVGRSIVVHAKADDFMTQPSGDAGGRIAVGVIGFAQTKKAQSATPPKASPKRGTTTKKKSL